MLNIAEMPKVVLEEKINLNSKNVWNSYDINEAIKTNNGQFIINRNLIDDTFDLKIQDIERPASRRDIPYVHINGIDLVDGINSNFYHTGNELFLQNKDWEIKRSMLNNIKLAKVKSFIVGLERTNLGHQIRLNNAYYWNFMFPKFPIKPNIIVSNFDKIIDIKTIEQIIVTNVPKKWRITPNFINQRLRSIPKIEYKYNHTYLVPIKPERLKTTNTFFEIYSQNESNNLIDYDFKISKGEFKSSSFTNKKMETYFENANKDIKTVNGYKLIGKIKTFDTSYYDYESKKTKS